MKENEFDYNQIDFSKKIELPEIKYPEKFTPGLKRLQGYVIEGMMKNPEYYESGGIPLQKMPPDVELRYAFFLFVTSINEIIANLNIVFSDFYDFKNNPYYFSGNPKDRVYLLMRTFFYEYFRIKENFHIFTKTLSSQGFVERTDLKSMRHDFAEYLKHAIEVRNNLVHARLNWLGKENMDLINIATAHNLGYAIVDKKTGEEFTIKEALGNFYNKFGRYLAYEGYRMTIFMQNLVNIFSEVALKLEKEETNRI